VVSATARPRFKPGEKEQISMKENKVRRTENKVFGKYMPAFPLFFWGWI
jgi:hypothetical protein